jgi:hypothetical protein
MQTDLLARTLEELSRRRGHWPFICRATGLDYNWLTKLAQGRIADPGIRKIQRLHDHLLPADEAAHDERQPTHHEMQEAA